MPCPSLDLDRMVLEGCEEGRVEHFAFTMTDSRGRRMYGVCLRGLFKGAAGGRLRSMHTPSHPHTVLPYPTLIVLHSRFDLGRRRRQCLCVVSKYPHFALFRVLLLQLHSLALTDQGRRPPSSSSSPSSSGLGEPEEAKSLQCWRFLESVYRQSQGHGQGQGRSAIPKTIVVAANAHPDLQMQRSVTLTLPRLRGIGSLQTEVGMPCLPSLLELIGWVVLGCIGLCWVGLS